MSKLITDADKKAKKVFFEVKAKKIELEVLKKENEDNIREFREAVNKYAREHNLPITNSFVEIDDEIEVPQSALKADFSPKLKKLYKKLAMKTHPDKLKGYPDDYVDMMKKYYEGLSESINMNCPSIIIDIAQKLNIDDLDLGVEEYLSLEGEKEELEAEIKVVKGTYAFIWAKSGKSENIIKLFLGVGLEEKKEESE